jgi:hypothetical protein
MKILASLIFLVLFLSCNSDNGIAPKPYVPETTGFSGRVTFLGNWPDSIQRTHVVMFKDPLLFPSDFTILNLRFIGWEIPFGVGYYIYSSADSSYFPPDGIIEAGEYSYIGVAQQSSAELSLSRKDWIVAGVYYAEGDTSQPGKITLHENTMVRNINITCDFDNPPPQPPGGN